MKRVIQWLTGTARASHGQPEVHFHQGPGATPAVCYDARCGSPRLDVG
jgi:hypothetical protein